MPQTNPPRRPSKLPTPPSLVAEVARLATALENAADPTRALRDTAAKVDELASQVRKARAAQLLARRDAVNDRIAAGRKARLAVLGARIAAVRAAAPAPTAATTTTARRASPKPPVRTQTRRGAGR